MARDGEGHSGREPSRSAGDATSALRHPVRREILRILHACSCERSPAVLAEELGIELKRTVYHVRVLDTYDYLIRIEGIHLGHGTTENRYKSAVEGSTPVLTILKATAADDAETLRQERAETEQVGRAA